MTRSTVDVHVLPDLPDSTGGRAVTSHSPHSVAAPTDGATALDPATTPAPAAPPAALRLLPGGATGGDPADDDQRHTLVRARRFVQAVVEIVSGDRPCTQMIRWTDREVYESLSTRVSAYAGISGSTPSAGRPRAKVVSVKVCRPRDGVAEIAAHVRQGRRSHAIAARLERFERRWICTALELG
jgi:hypothetical protein